MFTRLRHHCLVIAAISDCSLLLIYRPPRGGKVELDVQYILCNRRYTAEEPESHHHHHQVARPSMSIAVSTSWRHFRTVLCTLPRRVEAQFVWLEVEFDSTKPGPSRSTSWALPVRRETVDSCSEACWWSCDGSARVMWPKRRRRLDVMREVPWAREVIGPVPYFLVAYAVVESL